jgi:pimeloyl-ACP methyl ester carboxylesterase
MSTSSCFPYRSPAARDAHFAHYDSLVARKWPVVSEERTVPTSYGRTFVRITGPADAPPLVLLPGAVATSIMWAPNIKTLSGVYRTVALDQIGDAGRTTCDKPVRRLDDLLVWLDELFDGLELGDRINLVGVSFGGWLAAEYARNRPKRASGAVLLAPGATVLRLSAQFLIRLTLAAVGGPRGMRSMFRWMFPDMVRKDPAWLEEELERIAKISLQHRELPFPKVWTDAEWASLSVPTLFLVGEHETIYSAGKAIRRLKRVAPQVTVELIPGAGHDLTIVQAETINRKILEFLKLESRVSA